MAGLRGILKDPLLSVVMPVYNERATIEEIIGRVLGAAGASPADRRRRRVDRRHARHPDTSRSSSTASG